MPKKLHFLVFGFLLATPARADLASVTPDGFEVAGGIAITRTPAQVYAALGRIGHWWSPDHTYSGTAANLTLELRSGGCLCERLPGGGWVEHMRVVYVAPSQVLRLRGALGPLQGEGVNGALTFTLKPEGTGTSVSLSYVVGGYVRGGMEKIAPAVDMVLTDQLRRLKAYAEKPQIR